MKMTAKVLRATSVKRSRIIFILENAISDFSSPRFTAEEPCRYYKLYDGDYSKERNNETIYCHSDNNAKVTLAATISPPIMCRLPSIVVSRPCAGGHNHGTRLTI
jgi:hypothetical protein